MKDKGIVADPTLLHFLLGGGSKTQAESEIQ
jgi:hypothetical protein